MNESGFDRRLRRLEQAKDVPLLRVTRSGRCVGPDGYDCGHPPGTCNRPHGSREGNVTWTAALDGRSGFGLYFGYRD